MTFANGKRSWSCAIWMSCGLSFWAALAPGPARACTAHISPLGASYPRYDEQDVPTNVVLFADGAELEADDLSLRDQADHRVPIQTRAVEAGGFDLEPLQELLPNRAYVLEVADGAHDPVRVPFTTGRGPAALPRELFVPAWAPVQLRYHQGTCVDLDGYCTGARAQPDTTLEVRVGRRALWSSGDRPLGGNPDLSECMSIRARDVRGNRSQPAIACGEDIGQVDLRPSPPSPQGPSEAPDCRSFTGGGGELPAQDTTDVVGSEISGSGCTLHPRRPAAAASWLALGATLAALARRRSRPVL